MAGPPIQINKPEKFVGVSTPLEVEVQAPGAHARGSPDRRRAERQAVSRVLASPSRRARRSVRTAPIGWWWRARSANRRCRSSRTGTPRWWSPPSRKVLYGIRTVASTARRDVKVRLERPRVSVVSTHHYVNHGGTEMVVYRATPEDVTSGVVVGDVEYPGYPASGAALDGVKITDPALRVAFFALLHDQDLKTPIRLFARDEAGNTARADFDYRTFPKPFKRSRIELDRHAARSRRAGHPRRHHRGQAGGGQPREVPGDQRRAAAEERRQDRVVGGADLARDAVARRRCSTRSRTTRSSRRSRITAPTSTRARKSTSRSISDSTSPRSRARRSSRPTAARCCSPRSWASTATASSSITAWACSRSTGTSRRSTSRPGRRSRRNSSSAGAG